MFADERAEHLRAFVGVEVDDLDALSRSQLMPPSKLTDSPTTTLPIPNWRTSPLQYQQRASVVTITVPR